VYSVQNSLPLSLIRCLRLLLFYFLVFIPIPDPLRFPLFPYSTLFRSVQLLYTVFEEEDAITRSVIVKNAGNSNIYLEKELSTCLDMDDRNFEVIGLFGSWGRERHIQRMPVGYGRQNIASFKGEAGHQR